MMVLGITGGSGVGKTTLLSRVEARGGYVIDCDAVYHRLLREDALLLTELETRFPGVVEGGALNRKKLGKVVFDDRKALAALEAITHPRVVSEVKRLLNQTAGCSLAALDAAALLESGLGALCRKTVAVTAPLEARVRRLILREGISEEYARLRIAAQKTGEDYSARCDYTLYNDCPNVDAFAVKCDRFLSGLMEECGGNGN